MVSSAPRSQRLVPRQPIFLSRVWGLGKDAFDLAYFSRVLGETWKRIPAKARKQIVYGASGGIWIEVGKIYTPHKAKAGPGGLILFDAFWTMISPERSLAWVVAHEFGHLCDYGRFRTEADGDFVESCLRIVKEPEEAMERRANEYATSWGVSPFHGLDYTPADELRREAFTTEYFREHQEWEKLKRKSAREARKRQKQLSDQGAQED